MDRQMQLRVKFTRTEGDRVSKSKQNTIPNKRSLQHPTSCSHLVGSKKKDSATSTLSISTAPSSRTVAVKKISRIGSKYSSEWNKVYLDHPEIIKDKAKKLLSELEKKRIILNESSIERVIRGDPKEYLQIIKKIFTAYGSVLDSQCESSSREENVKSILGKLEGKTSDGVAALFGILTHILNYKPALNPVQFMQNRYTIQKLILCNEIVQRLSNYRPQFHM